MDVRSPSPPFDALVTAAADAVEPKVIAWRRDFHQHPELGNREVRTAGIVAQHLVHRVVPDQLDLAGRGLPIALCHPDARARDCLRDHLIESGRHMRPGSSGIRTSSAEPCRRSKGMNRSCCRGVLQIAEG